MPKVLSHKLNYFLIVFFIFLVGCQSIPLQSTQEIITDVENCGFQRQEYVTQTFRLTVFEKIVQDQSDHLHIYIEGDGNSWKSRYVLSDNPTPKQPLALQLAQRDQHSNVAYIARPCQYTSHVLDPHCTARYWSSHRYAPEVILAFHETLDQLKLKTKKTHLYLVGFSGGASVAALLAAERKDVVCLTTVAGDLNHEALSQYHQTTPLSNSLNPITIASQLKSLPQYHFSGAQDKVVPPWMAKQFAKAVNDPACVTVQIFPHVKHHKGWLALAENISSVKMSCSSLL